MWFDRQWLSSTAVAMVYIQLRYFLFISILCLIRLIQPLANSLKQYWHFHFGKGVKLQTCFAVQAFVLQEAILSLLHIAILWLLVAATGAEVSIGNIAAIAAGPFSVIGSTFTAIGAEQSIGCTAAGTVPGFFVILWLRLFIAAI